VSCVSCVSVQLFGACAWCAGSGIHVVSCWLTCGVGSQSRPQLAGTCPMHVVVMVPCVQPYRRLSVMKYR
jgi:hypothetical protein